MAVAQSAYRSSINISNISKSASSFGKGIAQSRSSVAKVNNILLKKTRFKRQSIAGDRILFNKRREAVRRREQEDIIESSGISGAIKRQGKVIASSTKGFLGRIMDFVGTLMVGWLINNLPLIVKLGEQVIQRIQKLVSTLGGFVSGITQILSGFGSLLGGVVSDIVRFNFSNIGKDISTSMNRITSGFESIESSFDDAMDILKKPFDFEEPEIPQGGVLPREGQPTPSAQPQPSGAEKETKGGRVSPQAVYSYLKQLGIDDTHALGILANIEGESGFEIGSQEKGDSKQGIGLFQYTYPSRKSAFLKAVPDYKTNWKGQIDFAIKSDPNTPLYLKKQFSSPEEAADDFMRNWENPDKGVYTDRRRKHNAFIKSFKPGSPKPAQTTPSRTTSAPPPPPAGINPNKKIAVNSKVGATVKTSGFGMRWEKHHGGIDLGCSVGTYISCKYPCKVVEASSESGYGYYTDIIIPSLNIRLRFAHLSKQLIKSGEVPAGKPFAQSGNSGAKTTGPHIHMEATRNMNGTAYGGDFNPDPYVDAMIFSTNPPAGFVAPPVPTNTSAKITAPSTGSTKQMKAMTPERSGPTVVVAQPRAPQMQAPMGGGGGGQSMSNVSSGEIELNRLMTQRLLLELAYT
jgi:hypothetical protein